MAGTAPQGYGWKHATTTPAAGWSETAPPCQANDYTSEGHCNYAPGTWTQAGWQDCRASAQWKSYSAHPRQESGWGAEYWSTTQQGDGAGANAPTSHWGSARQAAAAPGAKPGPHKSGGKGAQQDPLSSPPKARPQAESSSPPTWSPASPKCEPGSNFNVTPYFKELPPGTPSYRLLNKLKDLGLPRDPATWSKWQGLYFQEFSPLPDGWIRVWDEKDCGIACYRDSDGAVLLGASHTYFPTEEDWRARPRRKQPSSKQGGRRRSDRARMLDNLRSARFEAQHGPPRGEEDTDESSSELPPSWSMQAAGCSPGSPLAVVGYANHSWGNVAGGLRSWRTGFGRWLARWLAIC